MKRNYSGTADDALIAGLVARGEYAQLAPVARRLLSRTPDHPLGLKALAVAHISAGRHDEALPLLQRGVSLYPGDPELHSNLAIALAATGHYGESLQGIDAALAIAPERAEFHANRGVALLHLGALDAAIESCHAAIKLNPQQADAHNTLGAALHRKNRFADALEAFQAAARNNPESLDAFINFVVTLGDLDRFGEAATCARKVLEEGGLAQHEADALLPHLCAAERACCDWRRTDMPAVLRDTMRRRVDQGPAPFFMTHIEDIDRATLRHGAETYGGAYLRGSEHRLLVVGGKLVAAARGEMAAVVGDGKSTINELIDLQINSDPRRGAAEEFPLDVILLADNQMALHEVERQGYTPESVPTAGREVMVLRTGNHTCDITDLVHPSIAAAASLAARIVGLDIAGVDLVAEDISQPLDGQRGAIVEVNAGPGLLMHLKPENGVARPVGRAIVDHLFPNGDDGRIPVVGVTGSFGKTIVARLVARLLTLSGKCTGLACSDGLFLDRRLVDKGDRAKWEAANRILMNRAVEAAVFENGSDTILGEGLAYDRCQVGVITNIEPTRHYGAAYYIETPEQVYNVLRTQVDLVLPKGAAVLNASAPMLVEMAVLCDGEVIYFALDAELPAITEHRAQGKRAVLVRDGQVILASGADEIALTKLSNIPLTDGGKTPAQVENVLAAVGAAWALGITPDLMRIGIETFSVA